MSNTTVPLCLTLLLAACVGHSPVARGPSPDATRDATRDRTLDLIARGTTPPGAGKRIDAALAGMLRDPDSRRVTVLPARGGLVCGLVNARNGYGGYTGERPFVAWFEGGTLRDVHLFSADEMELRRLTRGRPTSERGVISLEERLLDGCEAP